MDPGTVAAAITLNPGRQESPALIPFSGPARKALELTVRTALRLGHNYVGTEHLLLALLEVEDDTGPLHSAGVDRDAVASDHVGALTARSADAVADDAKRDNDR